MDRKRPRDEDEGATQEGGELSMSIEETNKLRISLGLKPLNVGGAGSAAQKDAEERRQHDDRRKKKEQEERAKRFKEKQAERRAGSKEDAFLAVKGLGEADEDDDMASWVEKSRVAEVAKRAEDAYERRMVEKEAARKAAERGSDDEEGGGRNNNGYTAADLAGLKVRHGYDDLGAGETLVLTLADKKLIDDKGGDLVDDDDELINVLKAEDRQRQKAREAAAPKAKPLWEEDGKRRTLLDKYDEEEADAVLQIGTGGLLTAAQQEEIKRKLNEGGKVLESAAVGILAPQKPVGGFALTSGDYATGNAADAGGPAAAAAGFKKREKKKDKKEKKIRARTNDLETEDTAALIEQLEAQAQNGGEAAGSDLGSRRERATARERAEAAIREELAAKRAKFEAAVEKSNLASETLRPNFALPKLQPDVVMGEDEDDADRQLQESLARARRLAKQQAPASKVKSEDGEDVDMSVEGDDRPRHRSTVEDIAASAAKAREEEEAQLKAELAASRGKGSVVNDTMEFVRNISATPGPAAAGSVAAGTASVAGTTSRIPPPPGVADKDDYMDLGDEDEGDKGKDKDDGAPTGWTSTAPEDNTVGRWVSADETGAESGGAAGRAARRRAEEERRKREEEGEGVGSKSEEEDNVVREKGLGRGLGATLAMLKDRGALQTDNKIQWAGRTNDRSKNALQGLIGDVYAGGSHEDRIARSIEAALTTKDEFGRIMTPKERFRQLCYDFHGKRPSKNKEATRLAKAAEEIARRKFASSEVTDAHEVEGLKKVTEAVAQPFVVLQGKGAMDSLRAMKGQSTGMPPPPPPSKNKNKDKKAAIPGTGTPLLGDKKVEAMLGIKKSDLPGTASTVSGIASVSSGRFAPPPRPPPGA